MTDTAPSSGFRRVGGLPPVLADFFEHWLSLSRDGNVPTLEAFLDRPDPRFQPNTAIIDVAGLGTMSIRLFGTGLVAALGRDLTRGDANAWYNDRARAVMVDLSTRMLTTPCGLGCLRAYSTSKGRKVKVASLSLPLRRGGVVSSMVVYFLLAEAIDRDETATDLSEIIDPKWIDVGFGVPEDSAEHYIEQQRQLASPIGRRIANLWTALTSSAQRIRNRPGFARLFAGTGDAELTAFYDHWAYLKSGGVMPRLSDFLDRPQPRFQPYLTIMNVDAAGRPTVRLMGSERFDLPERSASVEEPMRVVYSPKLYPSLHQVTLQVVNRPVGFRALRTFESSDGQSHRAAVIALPLAVDTPGIRTFVHYQHLLGSRVYRGEAQVVTAIHNPAWIDIGAGVPTEDEVQV